MIKYIIDSIYPLSPKSLLELESMVVMANLKKGSSFINHKARDIKEYFVLEGVCRSYLVDPEGEEITISFFTSSSILSPHVTRTQKGISMLCYEALTDVELATLNAKDFERLIIRNVEVREFANTVLRNELSQKVEKEIGLVSLTAKERLLNFRNKFPLLENLVPHSTIASYLGITNVSLSRLRKDLMQ